MAKKTHAEYVAQVEALGKGFEVVGEYQGARVAIAHRCAERHEWNVTPNNVLSGKGCKKCAKSRPKKTHNQYVAEVNDLGNGFTVVGKYQGAKTPIAHRCAKGHEWDAQPTNILCGMGCPHCVGRIVSHDDYVESVKAHGFFVVDKYQGARVAIKHRCAEGHEWDATPDNIKRGRGCPHCSEHISDANVFYIWENADDPGVYKVGITSERCADKRIGECTSRNKMTANIIVMAAVDDALEIERRALELGDDPRYPDTLDGYTEFRRYSDAELGAVYQMAVQAA
jgi:hypothetical protein